MGKNEPKKKGVGSEGFTRQCASRPQLREVAKLGLCLVAEISVSRFASTKVSEPSGASP